MNLVDSLTLKAIWSAVMAENRKTALNPTWWFYSAPYVPTRFLLCKNYKFSLWTLPLESLGSTNGRVIR